MTEVVASFEQSSEFIALLTYCCHDDDDDDDDDDEDDDEDRAMSNSTQTWPSSLKHRSEINSKPAYEPDYGNHRPVPLIKCFQPLLSMQVV
jgi:hypothetical protein